MDKLKYINLIKQHGGENDVIDVFCRSLHGYTLHIRLNMYVDNIQDIKRKIAIAYHQKMIERKQLPSVSITIDNINWIIAGVSITVMTTEIYDRLPYINTTHVVLKRGPNPQENALVRTVVDTKANTTIGDVMRRFVDNYNNFTRMKTITEDRRLLSLSADMIEEKKQLHQCLKNLYFRYEDIPADAIRLLYDNKTQHQTYNNAKDEFRRIYKAAGKIIWDTLNSQIKSSIRNLNSEDTFNFLLTMPYTYNYLFISGLEDQKQKLDATIKLLTKENAPEQKDFLISLNLDYNKILRAIEVANSMVVPLDTPINFSTLYLNQQITDNCDLLVYDMCVQLL